VDELSAAAGLVPQVKYLIRRLKMTEAQELAQFALTSESASEILSRAQALVQNIARLCLRAGTECTRCGGKVLSSDSPAPIQRLNDSTVIA